MTGMIDAAAWGRTAAAAGDRAGAYEALGSVDPASRGVNMDAAGSIR